MKLTKKKKRSKSWLKLIVTIIDSCEIKNKMYSKNYSALKTKSNNDRNHIFILELSHNTDVSITTIYIS